MFTRDNLEVLRGIDDKCIDLIYLDPPFNSKHNYAAPIGSEAAGAAFKDTWALDDIDVEWIGLIADTNPVLSKLLDAVSNDSDKSYLVYMAIRLIEMHRVLKSTGSIYLHCDPTMSVWLRIVLDSIFGKSNFKNAVVWKKYGGHKNTAKVKFTTEVDILLVYSASKNYVFNKVYRPLSEPTIKGEYRHVDEDGRRYAIPRGRKYREGDIRKVYLDTNPGVAVGELWTEKELTMQGRDKERVGYPTQKPLPLLERIIKASSCRLGRVEGETQRF